MKTYYVRLLSYDEAVELIKAIDTFDLGYANITVGGVRVETHEINLNNIKLLLQKIAYRFEISEEHPTVTVNNIVKQLKETEEI